MALRNLTTVVYTDDEGNDYAMKIDASVFAQLNGGATAPLVGGSDYDGSPPLPPMPTNLKPRHVIVSNAGNKRRVICLSPTSDLFTGAETEIDLQVLGAAANTYTRSRKVSEAWKRRGDPTD
jgi:hypothetical protein